MKEENNDADKMGRPEIPINWDVVDTFCQFKPYLVDMVEYLNSTCKDPKGRISAKTLERRIKDNFGLTYVQYRDQKMWPTRRNLTQKALEMANKGNVPMLIFCLKNLCKWADNPQLGYFPMENQ